MYCCCCCWCCCRCCCCHCWYRWSFIAGQFLFYKYDILQLCNFMSIIFCYCCLISNRLFCFHRLPVFFEVEAHQASLQIHTHTQTPRRPNEELKSKKKERDKNDTTTSMAMGDGAAADEHLRDWHFSSRYYFSAHSKRLNKWNAFFITSFIGTTLITKYKWTNERTNAYTYTIWGATMSQLSSNSFFQLNWWFCTGTVVGVNSTFVQQIDFRTSYKQTNKQTNCSCEIFIQ